MNVRKALVVLGAVIGNHELEYKKTVRMWFVRNQLKYFVIFKSHCLSECQIDKIYSWIIDLKIAVFNSKWNALN